MKRDDRVLVLFTRDIEPNEAALIAENIRDPELKLEPGRIQTGVEINSAEKLRRVVNHCGANVVIDDGTVLSRLPEGALVEAIRSMTAEKVNVLELTGDWFNVLRLDGGRPPRVTRDPWDGSMI